jgi:hypothetical protein
MSMRFPWSMWYALIRPVLGATFQEQHILIQTGTEVCWSFWFILITRAQEPCQLEARERDSVF